VAAITLSHSQALRVIGQDLVPISCDSFELSTVGDDYIVTWYGSETAPSIPSRKAFLNHLLRNRPRGVKSQAKASNQLYFSRAEILLSDLERQAKRRLGSPTDVRDLSFVLRVLGNHLDQKSARAFFIAWSPHLIRVQHNGKEEIFTPENVYDFGIRMYLKRSDRRSS
jgi:hypothetical protein